MTAPPTSETVICPLHSTVTAQVQDHEQRLRAIEHCDVDQVTALGDRVRNLEDWALVVKTKSAIYGALGAFIGGVVFQIISKYLLHL